MITFTEALPEEPEKIIVFVDKELMSTFQLKQGEKIIYCDGFNVPETFISFLDDNAECEVLKSTFNTFLEEFCVSTIQALINLSNIWDYCLIINPQYSYFYSSLRETLERHGAICK